MIGSFDKLIKIFLPSLALSAVLDFLVFEGQLPYLIAISPIFIPATCIFIALAINHYFFSQKIQIEINYHKEFITLRENLNIRTYSFNEVKYSVYHLNRFYRNIVNYEHDSSVLINLIFSKPFDPWLDFGYWFLEFNDGYKINISSLVTDLMFDYPIIPNTKYKFSFAPFMIAHKRIEGRDLCCNLLRYDYFKLYDEYVSYPSDKLEDIKLNPMDYQKMAVDIASQILKERRKTFTNNSYKR